MKKRFAILMVAVLLPFLSVPMVAQGPAEIAIANPDFEGGFSVREAQEVEVANGWDYSYMSGDDRWCRAPCYRPEYKPETSIAVSGTSQRWFSTFARQFGTIHQLVNVEADRWYTFSCQVQAISEPDGQLAAMVGGNPWGIGVYDRTMIWGEQQPWASYRKWNTLSVTFRAYGGRVRVAVGCNNNYPTKNNACYVDNCRLVVADGPEPGYTPTPQPTYTPYPTLTPWPTYTPQPTPDACPTCTPGTGCDCPSIGDIRDVIREEIRDRDPVVWPK